MMIPTSKQPLTLSRHLIDRKTNTKIYARGYNQSPDAVTFYKFTRTLQSYISLIGEDTSLAATTDSDLFKFLKSMNPDADVVLAQCTGHN